MKLGAVVEDKDNIAIGIYDDLRSFGIRVHSDEI